MPSPLLPAGSCVRTPATLRQNRAKSLEFALLCGVPLAMGVVKRLDDPRGGQQVTDVSREGVSRAARGEDNVGA